MTFSKLHYEMLHQSHQNKTISNKFIKVHKLLKHVFVGS